MKVKLISIVILSFFLTNIWGHEPQNRIRNKSNQTKLVPRENCAPATKQIDQDINNVRARLLNGGDVWNDLGGGNNRKGRYIVPKIEAGSGKNEVSSLYSGGVWVGGLDPAGALKMMGQTFRSATENDCWPGPLTEEGEATTKTCLDWDRFFRVSGDNIRILNRKVNASSSKQISIDEVPEDLRYFPCRGNKEFEAFYKFPLPNTSAGLALFFDKNDNRIYEPELGEYPTIDIKGCPNNLFPDDMIFWIYNDNGGIHTNTRGEAIRMEVQVQAFAFRTADELNDMTFQRYKLVNRAPQAIRDCYFAMWIDPDLGCYTDDYVGCDTSWTGKIDTVTGRRILRDLMYIYNIDATDGANGCTCDQNVNTYCNDVPIVGVDYFRGPLDSVGNELGMSYFMYYNNNIGSPPQGSTDPATSQEYYNYMKAIWKDGEPLTTGGTGKNLGGTATKYAFPSPPNDPAGWSMCSQRIGEGDRRTIQSTGPLSLLPGAKNELIIGIPWVPDQVYPCPALDDLLKADQLCQDLFDNCFELKDGPDAPNVDFVELDRELILLLSNAEGSNNFNEAYAGKGLGFPPNVDDLYRFQGYRVFQVANQNTSLTEANIADPSKVREIFTVDLKDGIRKIYNWVGVPNPTPSKSKPLIFYPTLKVEGLNSGIKHTFQITEDAFATGINKRLINHQKYYFIVLAYAYNNYKEYVSDSNIGQRTQYCPGRLNLGPAGDGRPYIATPRPQRYEIPRSKFGDGVTIIRHDGIGTGDNFLKLSESMYDKMLDVSNFDKKIEYAPGGGPIDIKIVNPLKVKDGEYELRFSDSNLDDNKLDKDATWSIKGITDPSILINSTGSIELLNDQIIRDLGITVTIGQVQDAGIDPLNNPRNGVIGEGLQYNYKDENGVRWFVAQPERNISQINFIKTELGAKWNLFDPNGVYESLGSGVLQGTWYPYKFVSGDSLNITPAWLNPSNGNCVNSMQLAELNSVDIVFTSDKSKWTRCPVIETWNRNNIEPNLEISPVSNLKSFQLKDNLLSVGKNDANGDGKADPDGEKDANGKDLKGMGWFPGYAVDVETGTRLNIFFGENSLYSPENGVGIDSCLLDGGTGNDLMWNPTSQIFLGEREEFQGCGLSNSALNIVLGGHHYIYVTRSKYDEGKQLYTDFTAAKTSVARAIKVVRDNITWCSMPALFDNTIKLNPLGNGPTGLIPNDLTVSLRVRNPYNVDKGTNENQAHNLYRFIIGNQSSQVVVKKDEYDDAMRDINVVPNPYYAYSAYETGQFSNIVKITNLPPKCNVTIYSLDGKFIKQYKRDEKPVLINDASRGLTERQIAPDIEWDLTNFKSIPIASGTYLIHVEQPETGAVKIIKWFGVIRKFDPSGL